MSDRRRHAQPPVSYPGCETGPNPGHNVVNDPSKRMTWVEAAEHLAVSVSRLQRLCRRAGINLPENTNHQSPVRLGWTLSRQQVERLSWWMDRQMGCRHVPEPARQDEAPAAKPQRRKARRFVADPRITQMAIERGLRAELEGRNRGGASC